MNYAVRVYIEGNLNLRDSARSGSNAVEMEHAEGLVILGKFALALQYMHLNRGLTVGSG